MIRDLQRFAKNTLLLYVRNNIPNNYWNVDTPNRTFKKRGEDYVI